MEEINFEWDFGNCTDLTIKDPENESMTEFYVEEVTRLKLTITSNVKLVNYTWFCDGDVKIIYSLLYRMCKILVFIVLYNIRSELMFCFRYYRRKYYLANGELQPKQMDLRNVCGYFIREWQQNTFQSAYETNVP